MNVKWLRDRLKTLHSLAACDCEVKLRVQPDLGAEGDWSIKRVFLHVPVDGPSYIVVEMGDE
jgi:hypothetical protein